MQPQFRPLEILIDRRCLTIRIGLETIVAETLPYMSESEDEIRVRNLSEFGKGIVSALVANECETILDAVVDAVGKLVTDDDPSLITRGDKDFNLYPSIEERQEKRKP